MGCRAVRMCSKTLWVAGIAFVFAGSTWPRAAFAEESPKSVLNARRFEELTERTKQLYKEQRLDEAVTVAQEALVFAEQHFPSDDPKLAAALFNLGGFYQYRVAGKEQEGKALIERARAIRAKHGLSLNPLGLHTEAFFDAVALKKGRFESREVPPQQEDVRKSCDLDRDGDCDTEDITLFNASLGRCSSEFRTATDVEADANGDGCITAMDRSFLFPEQLLASPAQDKSGTSN